ncbi:hypothetical protein GNX18_09290 [Microbulbifer sp. SH-1]|uniref:hypothetical protein n=1 Tax=Microbulbifer sp. SH-1 TaxID=2681547 RepID=UPI00140D926D|nr:hypothetical protein [Microbulbifer sp. SH-1]QIL89927.1 hypothetical protein GNX18_09290 [Microbulbifer sp. SH-1]
MTVDIEEKQKAEDALSKIKSAVSKPDKKRAEALTQLKGKLASGTVTKVDPLVQSQLDDSQNDRELKKRYANYFIWILVGQLFAMNLAFILVGFKWMEFERYELELYLAGTLAEVFGIVLIITKNLFPNRKPNTK